MKVGELGAIEVTSIADYNAVTLLVGICVWTIGLMVATIWAAIGSRE
jgi:hypothetical protein